MGIVKQSLQDKQFSSEVAEHVSKARRVSTAKVYDAKWQIFRDWANQRKIDPIQATPQIVADFLTFLFSVKKCQVSTIKGYRSTISNTLKYKTGYDFGSHPVLLEVIKSFAIQRPVDRSLAPKCDLAFVLSHMCKAPFEPLDKALLFYLSVKTVFLVTLATARRVSEVHALSMDSDHLRFSNLDGSLILGHNWDFWLRISSLLGLLILSKSAVWSSSSLFASHYLRDFREQTENLRAMGPIIAAQKVVGAVPIWSPMRTSDTRKYTLMRGIQLV